jgi:hypothetical protein
MAMNLLNRPIEFENDNAIKLEFYKLSYFTIFSLPFINNYTIYF